MANKRQDQFPAAPLPVDVNTFLVNGQTNGTGDQQKILLRDMPILRQPDNIVVVNEAADFGVIDSTKVYLLGGVIDMGSTSLEVPVGGISIDGLTPDTAKLTSSDASFALFTSPVGGSGNITLNGISIEITGTGSQVYDVFSVDGFGAVEVTRVNYNNCSSLGTIDNYRQGFESVTGRFGGKPELELKGVWLGGYSVKSSVVRFLVDGAYSLFKAGAGFSMASRFRTDVNVDLNATVSLLDFTNSNFPNPSTLQLKDCIVTRNGVLNASDSSTLPNISKTELASWFTGNSGIGNTFVGGRTTVTTEVETTINTIDVFETLNGTYTADDLQHFDAPSNGQLRHLGDIPSDYRIHFELVIDGTANEQVEVRIRHWDDSALSFVNEQSQIRQINNLQGARDVAYFSLSSHLTLDKNDYIFIEVANKTSTANVTAELGSFMSVEER